MGQTLLTVVDRDSEKMTRSTADSDCRQTSQIQKVTENILPKRTDCKKLDQMSEQNESVTGQRVLILFVGVIAIEYCHRKALKAEAHH